MKGGSGFPSIRTEGGLLPSGLLARVAAGDKDLGGLTPEGYHLGGTERLNEAINRSWSRLLGAWTGFQAALADLPASDKTATGPTRQRWSLLLFQELGFGQLQPAKAQEIAGKAYPVSHLWGRVPIHLVGARVDLERPTKGVVGAARMSPHGMMQELVNRSDEFLWGFVSNGLALRLLRDNVSLTRQAYVEFDLESMLDGQSYADFVVLWLLCHQSRVEGEVPEKFLLERWAQEAAEQGTRALEQLRVGVEAAIAALGEGFIAHPANAELRDRLRSGALDRQDLYRQVLRLVYRLLFLFVAEDRGLLAAPGADLTALERYRRFYSLDRLRRLAAARRGAGHGDLWEGLRVVFNALGDERGCSTLALPALGSLLWSKQTVPDLASAQLANRHLLDAVRVLSSTREGKIERAVDYRNLGAEELGSVYESLLELHPEVDVVARHFSLTSASGNERKTTGSYYTPTSLITELLNSALDPLLAEAAGQPDPETAILNLTVLDPACGSGHFLIAAAHRIARRLAAVRTGEEEPSPAATRTALRDVIGHCIYGVDVNEMAVELCKVSLWMEALEPGKPLSFLDHRIACGDSLLGTTPALLAAGIPDSAFKPIEGDDKKVVSALRVRNARERSGQGSLALVFGVGALQVPLVAEMTAIDALPDTSIVGVREKEERYARLQTSPAAAGARLIADAWCSAFVSRKTEGAPDPITEGVMWRLRSNPEESRPGIRDTVERLAGQYRFLHWHLAFPDVFRVPAEDEEPTNPQMGWNGGFDLVLGNPPWERVKLQEKEWFAARRPDIATAPNAAARRRMIAALEEDDPPLHEAFLDACRQAEGESHVMRNSGRYPLCGRGDINTYAIFAEAMRSVVAPTGRAGVIVPSGIATDDTTKHFFADLVERRSLVSLYDFENRQGLFPDVDSRMKFCLLTLSGLGRPVKEGAEFVFFAHSTSDLGDLDRRFTLSAEDLALLNPNTRTCPVFRWKRDAELTKSIYRRVPVLVADGPPERNPWGVKFMRMFDMTNDSGLFRTGAQLEAEGWTLAGNTFRRGPATYLPLYEGRMGHQFTHRFATQPAGVLSEVPPKELQDPDFLVQPEYWVPAKQALERLDRRASGCATALLGHRRVARNTDERTVIAAVIPWGAASYGWILTLGPSASDMLILASAYNSFVFDYLLRNAVSQPSITQGTFEQIACPAPEQINGEKLLDAIVPRALELTYTAWDLAPFAAEIGCEGPPFRWDGDRRTLLRAELDAAFFHLYDIERGDVDYIMETFPIVKRKDDKEHGEYRTKRLILECYDAMARAADTGIPYQTILDPPPADSRGAHPARLP